MKKILALLIVCVACVGCANKASLVDKVVDRLKMQANVEATGVKAMHNEVKPNIKSDIRTELRDDNKHAIQGDHPVVVNVKMPEDKKQPIEKYIMYAILAGLCVFLWRSKRD